MAQSHLLQILALVTMEPIATISATDLRGAMADVLRACRLWGDDPGCGGHAIPDCLRLSMSPDRLALEINVNGPGDPLDLEQVSLYSDLNPGRLPAYGEVLSGRTANRRCTLSSTLHGHRLLRVQG